MIALEALKGRLVDGLLEVQKEEGYVARERFIFNRGATDEQLALLPAWTADDYQAFLRQHNGAKLFQHETLSYNDGFELFSIEDCLTYSEIWECPENFLAIGAGPDGEWIVYEMNRPVGNRIWSGEFLNFEEWEEDAMQFGFERWLDYLIVAQGTQFWEWFR